MAGEGGGAGQQVLREDAAGGVGVAGIGLWPSLMVTWDTWTHWLR